MLRLVMMRVLTTADASGRIWRATLCSNVLLRSTPEHCETRLSLIVSARYPVVASTPALLLAHRSVYGAIQILRINFEALNDARP